MSEGLTSEVVKVNPRTREHQAYYVGKTRVPSVTGVLANLGWKFPALMAWQLKMIRQGIDPEALKTEAGTVGTLVHSMIQAFLTDTKVDLQFFSKDQIDRATLAFDGFMGWYEENDMSPIAVEEQLTHAYYRYGGTIDLRCKMRGKSTLCDFKTATAIFLDHRIQLAAYERLVLHKYKKPVQLVIIHLNKETGTVTPHEYLALTKEWECFKLLLRLNKLKQEFKA